MDVINFEGRLGKEIEFKARWTLIDPATRQAVVVEQSHITEEIGRAGYEALVIAHSRVLARLSEEIASKLLALSSNRDHEELP